MRKEWNLGGVLSLGLLVLLQAASAFSATPQVTAQIPDCLDDGKVLPVDNGQVLYWKTTTKNQWLSRAHVKGTVSQVFPDRNGHVHFEIALGAAPGETLEVVYNTGFGKIPDVTIGMEVEACGDYITSNAATSQYQASPSGAIIHWVHASTSPRHESGYLVMNGVLCGYRIFNRPSRPYRPR